jgi:hypothetical protein
MSSSNSKFAGGARRLSRRSRRSRRGGSRNSKKPSRRSRRNPRAHGVNPRSQKSRSRRSKSPHIVKKPAFPKTARLPSKRSKSVERMQMSRANTAMSMTELQFMAKSRGIPFGALTKTKLVRKINNYESY